MIRTCYDFRDPYTIKAVYCSIVRPILEYASVVWTPLYEVHIKRIENIQRSFLRFALRKLGWRDRLNLLSYTDRCQLINIQTLEVRRRNAGLLFAFDIFNGNVDSPALLGILGLNVPSRPLRDTEFLHRRLHRTNYGLAEPICNIIRLVNDCKSFDFGLSRKQFKNLIERDHIL